MWASDPSPRIETEAGWPVGCCKPHARSPGPGALESFPFALDLNAPTGSRALEKWAGRGGVVERITKAGHLGTAKVK